jgi:hypothetical protein
MFLKIARVKRVMEEGSEMGKPATVAAVRADAL